MNYGRYQIIKEVGRGSMGIVYQARDPNIDRLVAVKVLRHDRITTDSFVKRFLKEAKVIGRLSHPHIVTIHDVGEDQGTVYIAMEFLEGISLSEIIQDRCLDAKEVIDLGTQIAETLDYAHRKGVIHRDIKPSNIVVEPDGQIKITDFGIARIEDSSATLQTQAGAIMGTPAYMSPEQVLGHSVDGRSDLFSLGVILYELSTGRRPFGGDGKNLATVFNEIIQITPPEPTAVKSNTLIPEELSSLIMKTLEKEPAKRFQTGKELQEMLKNCLNGDKLVSVKKTNIRSNLKYLTLFTVILAVLIAAGGIYFYAGHFEISAVKQPAKLPRKPVISKPVQPSLPSDTRVITGKKTDLEIPAVKPVPTPPVAPPEHRIEKKAENPEKKLPIANSTPVSLPVAIDQAQSKKEAQPKTKEQMPLPVDSRTMPKFAFLKVRTTPKGARVYINDTLKGKTPLTIKLDLGKYRVRLTRAGYRDIESQIKLEKMTEYPLQEKLKRIE
jgi:serine/threonine protein kinase